MHATQGRTATALDLTTGLDETYTLQSLHLLSHHSADNKLELLLVAVCSS